MRVRPILAGEMLPRMVWIFCAFSIVRLKQSNKEIGVKWLNMAIFLGLDNRFKVNLGKIFGFIDPSWKLFAPIFGF